MSCNRFFKDYEKYIARRYNDNTALPVYLSQFLSGEALEWYNLQKDDIQDDYDSVKKALKAHFEDMEKDIKLQTLTQFDPSLHNMEDWINGANKYFMSRDCTPEQAMLLATGAVPQDFKDAIKAAAPKNWSKLQKCLKEAYIFFNKTTMPEHKVRQIAHKKQKNKPSYLQENGGTGQRHTTTKRPTTRPKLLNEQLQEEHQLNVMGAGKPKTNYKPPQNNTSTPHNTSAPQNSTAPTATPNPTRTFNGVPVSTNYIGPMTSYDPNYVSQDQGGEIQEPHPRGQVQRQASGPRSDPCLRPTTTIHMATTTTTAMGTTTTNNSPHGNNQQQPWGQQQQPQQSTWQQPTTAMGTTTTTTTTVNMATTSTAMGTTTTTTTPTTYMATTTAAMDTTAPTTTTTTNTAELQLHATTDDAHV